MSIEDDILARVAELRIPVPSGPVETITAPAFLKRVIDVADVIADRETQHGDFNVHAEFTQRLKVVLHSSPNWLTMTNTQREGLEMIAHKVGRVLAGNPNHADHWLDIEGYARITRERL